MASAPFSKRTILILPAVLLTVDLLEGLLAFKIRRYVPNVYTRTAVILFCYGVGFVIAATWITPLLRRFFTTVRQHTRREAGTLGLLIFYAAAYGALYYAYLLLDRIGPAALLPTGFR